MSSSSYPSPRNWQPHTGVFGAADGNRIEGGVLLAHERLDAGVVNPYAVHLYPTGTDQTAQITSAIANAVSAAQTRGDNYAEVIFAPGEYLIQGAPTTGGATAGSAQIPLPVISDRLAKVVLELRGISDASHTYHWEQLVVEKSGVVFHTNYVGPSTVPSTGEVSVLGGPTPHYGYGSTGPLFSNMLVIVDGITIVNPTNPKVCGFDFRGVAQVTIKSAAVLAEHSPNSSGVAPVPDPTWGWGLAMPDANNNDKCDITYYSAEGQVNGLVVDEHVSAPHIRLLSNYNGIRFKSNSGFPHHNWFGYVSCEACENVIRNDGFAKFTFACLNIEIPNSAILIDSANWASGSIVLSSNISTSALAAKLNTAGVINGGTGVRIYSENQPTGAVTAPAVPATTVALQNPFWRDAMVVVAGGTVTSIKVDGQTLGITSGTVFVPTGKTITLGYSVAPTWTWTLL